MTKRNEALEALVSRLDYDPETGQFRWRYTGKGRSRAGSLAGTTKLNGYIEIGIRWAGNRYIVGAHRVAWRIVHGIWPATIDHKDGNPSNNRITNLRASTRALNAWNRARRRTNSSGATGVYWVEKERLWRVEINAGRRIRLGSYIQFEDAVRVRQLAERIYHGELGSAASRGGCPSSETVSEAEFLAIVDTLRHAIRRDNTSGSPGVTRVAGNRWMARITSNGKRVYLGLFDSFEAANSARENALRRPKRKHPP